MTKILKLALAGACASVLTAGAAMAQQAPLGFFITSAPLDGGNLGGLAGADRHCQALAAAVGAGNRTWRAYLSTQGAGAVNARDRIGRGPWANARGVVIAANVAELHGTNNLTKQTALTEAAPWSMAAATRRTNTTSSPAPRPTARPSRAMPTAPAATGRRTARARPWSATMTAWASTPSRRRCPGTPRIPRAAATCPRCAPRRRRPLLLLRRGLKPPSRRKKGGPRAALLMSGALREGRRRITPRRRPLRRRLPSASSRGPRRSPGRRPSWTGGSCRDRRSRAASPSPCRPP